MNETSLNNKIKELESAVNNNHQNKKGVKPIW